MEFDKIWSEIRSLEGERFYTVTNQPFTYEFHEDYIIINKPSSPKIYKGNFEKAVKIMPLQSVSHIKNLVRGPSYVYALLTDKRIVGKV